MNLGSINSFVLSKREVPGFEQFLKKKRREFALQETSFEKMKQDDKIAEYLIRKETITGKEFMKIFRAVERGMEIPENLDELVFPEDVKELEDKAENQETEISQSHSAETSVSADELSGEEEL